MKRLFVASVAIFSIILVMATYAGAAYYNGQDIDGIVFDGAVYLFDFDSGEPVKAVFSGYLVAIHWENGEVSKFLLDSMEIDPGYIELFTDPDQTQPLINPILEIFL